MRESASLLDALLELQALDRVPRAGYLMRGVADPESICEHGWHLALLIWSLAPRVPEVDLGRALELALVHDLAEIRIGDLPRTAAHYLPEGAKEEAEAAALAELMAPLGERAPRLFAEYRAGETPAARLVRACDKLQMMIKVFAYERWGAGGLAEFWQRAGNFPEPGFAPVDELFADLRQRRAAWLAERRAGR